MNWLARLKKLDDTPDATLQKLRKGQEGVSVVFVGPGSAYSQNSIGEADPTIVADADPANDPATPITDLFTARIALFTDRGLNMDDASALADRMAHRDDEHDDRRICLECKHLSGDVVHRRCSQWRKLWIGDASTPADLVDVLQRCAGFNHRLEVRP